MVSPYPLGFGADKQPVINALAAGVVVVALAVWQIHDAITADRK